MWFINVKDMHWLQNFDLSSIARNLRHKILSKDSEFFAVVETHSIKLVWYMLLVPKPKSDVNLLSR